MMNAKKMTKYFTLSMLFFMGLGVYLAIAQEIQQAATPELKMNAPLPEGKYARLDTTQGKILILLLEKQAPKTVENFIALATGEKEYTDPKTGQKTKRRFYDGSIFYRVRNKQFVQGGCPLGTGTGELGFTIPDEIDPAGQQVAGTLSMFRNMSAKDSANSQFILSCAPLDWLNGKLAIFGQTVYGLNVIESISLQKVGLKDKPLRNIVLNKVTIIEVTAEAPLTVSQAINYGDRAILVAGETLSDEERLRIEEANKKSDADTQFYYMRGRFPNTVWARDIIGTPKETLLDAKTWLELRKRMAEERDAQSKKEAEEKIKKEKEKEK
jgi:peptidyl-prolyl cis-trans isomerase A (cyclophilin A)